MSADFEADTGSVGFLLADLLDGRDDAIAVRVEGRQFSREQLRDAAQSAANGLRHLGLTRGDTIAVWLPNGAVWLQLLFAAARLGLLVVPISTRYKHAEVSHLLSTSGARALVCLKRFLNEDFEAIATRLKSELASLDSLVWVDDVNTWLALPSPSQFDAPAPVGTAGDLLSCFSTSGTTGHPKLAAHDHGSIARHARAAALGMDIRPGDALLCAVPLFGVFGFIAALAALAGGATCVLMAVFDADKAAQLIRDARVSHAIGSDAMFAPILALGATGRSPKDTGPHWPAWRHIVQADFVGLALAVTEQATLQGIRSSGTYGSSEVFSLMALQDWNASNAERALGGGAVVDSAIQVRVVHPETGVQLGDDEPGELQIKGPNVLARYLNNPQATAKAMTPDGWYRSGDLATTQGSRFTYLARMGDSLRLRGFLVNPAEIEACLMQYPGVTGAQVVGVQRAGLGDQAVGYVVLARAEEAAGIEARLLAHCRANMASYKVPVCVKVLAEFPTLSGPNGVKIQKRVLREQARTDILNPT